MTRRRQLAMVAALLVLCLGCARRGEQESPGEQELKISEWVTSDDGALSLRMLAHSPIARGDSLVLRIELRNNRDSAILLRKPFSKGHRNWYAIEITGPGGKEIRYAPEAIPSSTMRVAPVFIAPGRVLHLEAELSERIFSGIDRPGKYAIVYTYRMQGWELSEIVAAEDARREDVWLGEIRSGPITVKRSWLP